VSNALPGQIPLLVASPEDRRSRTAALLSGLLSRTRRSRVDLSGELECPGLVRLRSRRRRRFLRLVAGALR
jgi:hypothetical protein